MFLADYHTHSSCSFDGKFTMTQMAQAAIDAGLCQICITDHVEMEDSINPVPFYNAECYSSTFQKNMTDQYEAALKNCGNEIDIRKGIELSSYIPYRHEAELISSDPTLDFVIGSIHNMTKTQDFYFIKYETQKQCDELYARYLQEYITMAGMGLCNSIGHIGYPERYMHRDGFDIDPMRYRDALEALLKKCIEVGCGLEMNTSGLRQGLNKTLPGRDVFALYRELGGEIVTVGSDAHLTKDVGAEIANAYEILKEIGFKYITVFKKRKPEFIKL